MLLGDFNAHTNCENDIIKYDEFVMENVCEVIQEDVYHINTKPRKSKDVHKLNFHGRQLIESQVLSKSWYYCV